MPSGLVLMKFDVNDPWIVPSQNTVFHQLILIKGSTLIYIESLWKKSIVFSSETTGLILMKFDVNYPLGCSLSECHFSLPHLDRGTNWTQQRFAKYF